MVNNEYMVAESTLLTYARNFSMQSDKDLQNGAIVGKGNLIEGEREVYETLDDYSGGMYLVLNPAWSYKNDVDSQNEENYINKAGIAFRAYGLEKDMKFTIYNIGEKFEVGDGVKYDASTGKYAKDDDSNLKVVSIKDEGFPICVGIGGSPISGDELNEYGYAIGNRTVKYTIEVVK